MAESSCFAVSYCMIQNYACDSGLQVTAINSVYHYHSVMLCVFFILHPRTAGWLYSSIVQVASPAVVSVQSYRQFLHIQVVVVGASVTL